MGKVARGRGEEGICFLPLSCSCRRDVEKENWGMGNGIWIVREESFLALRSFVISTHLGKRVGEEREEEGDSIKGCRGEREGAGGGGFPVFGILREGRKKMEKRKRKKGQVAEREKKNR